MRRKRSGKEIRPATTYKYKKLFVGKKELSEKILRMKIAALIIGEITDDLRNKNVRIKTMGWELPLRRGMGQIGLCNSATLLQIDSYFRVIKNM